MVIEFCLRYLSQIEKVAELGENYKRTRIPNPSFALRLAKTAHFWLKFGNLGDIYGIGS
jgi:hypothetical protein